MDLQLPFLEIVVFGGFLFILFPLSGLASHWSGMTLQEIDQELVTFKNRYHNHNFYQGYPRPRLETDRDQYEGCVSWRRGLGFFGANLVVAIIVMAIVSQWWQSGLFLTVLVLVEWFGVRRFVASRQQFYVEDMAAVGTYYGAELRLVGTLGWARPYLDDGYQLNLRFTVNGSTVLPDGVYNMPLYMPEERKGDVNRWWGRFGTSDEQLSVFLVVRHLTPGMLCPDALVALHALYPGVLAQNTERDLRVARSFASRVEDRTVEGPPESVAGQHLAGQA